MTQETINSDTEAPAEESEESADETSASVSAVDLPELNPVGLAGAAPPENLGRVMDVSVPVTARVGMVRKTISDVVDLAPGAIIDLERGAGEPIDLVIGDKLIARGEIVVVDDRYGVRIVEVIQE